MTRTEFANGMALLSASVGREMERPMAEAWFQLLSDLTEAELRLGIMGALKAHPVAGFPPVGQILKFARPSATPVDLETRSNAAWEGLLTAIRQVGGYSTVSFDDAAVTATVRSLGGWVALTEKTTEELTRFVRPQFIQTYKSLVAVGVRAEAASPLPGLLDIENNKAGYTPQEPTLVSLNLPGPAPKLLPGIVHSERVQRIAAQPSDEPVGTLFVEVAGRAAT